MIGKKKDPEIRFEPGNRYFAALIPFGEAVINGKKQPEYSSEYISRALGTEEAPETEMNSWADWGVLEEDSTYVSDLELNRTFYRLEDNSHARRLASEVYREFEEEYDEDIERFLEEGDMENVYSEI